MKKKFVIIMFLAMGFAYSWGVMSHAYNLFPMSYIHTAGHMFVQRLFLCPPIKDDFGIESKQEVEKKSLQGETLTILVFGQSNAANFGKTRKSCKLNVYNLYYANDKLYKASDPLLGANGEGGSVWTRLGDKLIEQGFCSNVVFIPIAVGSSEIQRWDVGGDLHGRIEKAIKSAKNYGLTIDRMLWHQGESDVGLQITKDNYKKMFMSMLKSIRNQGVKAPIYIAVATNNSESNGKVIYDAQVELCNNKDIFLGPKVFDDIKNLDDRYQFVHYSDSGLNLLADLWIKSMKEH